MSAVDQYSRSQPNQEGNLIFDPARATPTSSFQASRAPVAIAREKEHSVRHSQKGRRGMCADTLNPGGEVEICSVGCILGMPEIAPFVLIVAASRYMGRLEQKKCFPSRSVLGAAEFRVFLVRLYVSL